MNASLALQERINQLAPAFERAIKDRLGLLIRYQKKELEQTIIKACEIYQCSPEEYLESISHCAEDSPMLEHLVTGITIGETYFFRDKNQMKLLQELILPSIVERKRKANNLSLRIWSAGCATGEEIYTIAMLLFEMIPDLSSWSLNLLGTDINTVSLRKAMAGKYSEWSMRSISSYFKTKYFAKVNQKYNLSSLIRNQVKFDYLNLHEGVFPSILSGTNAQDLILCRNVLIYFDNEKIASLMQKLAKSLSEEGYLMLGASDPVDISKTNLIFHHKKGALFSAPTIENIPLTLAIKKDAEITQPFSKARSQVMNKAVTTSFPKQAKQELNEMAVTKLIDDGNWLEILKLGDYQKSYLLNAKAIASASLGKLDQALHYCEKSIALDGTNKHTYLIFGLILTEVDRVADAEKALRKTLFLDRLFVIGHFQLGLLLLRNKQKKAGLKSLRNALTIVTHQDPSKPVMGFKGFDNGRLKEILTHEIDLYVSAGGSSDANKAT